MDYKEKLKAIINSAKTPYVDINTLLKYFPELVESEDEKIRKEITIYLSTVDDKELIPYESWIAWLKKRGERDVNEESFIEGYKLGYREASENIVKEPEKYGLQKQVGQKSDGTFVNVDDVREDFVNEVYRVLNVDHNNDRANQIIDAFDNLPTVVIEKQGEQIDLANKEYWRGYREGMQEILDKYAELEKQCEQKQDPCKNCKHVKLNCHNFPCITKRAFEQGKSVLEVINEETVDNANKVESKFMVGDWIVYNKDNSSREIMRIYDIRDNRYYFTDNVHFSWSIKECDEKSHLWSIQDAKEGDILYMDNELSTCTFIYKSINKGLVQKYASYNKFGFEGEHYLVLNGGYIRPATKEQCDDLFKAMVDADYEWDAKKKKLKKISQRMVSAEAKEAMYSKPTS